MMRRVCLAAGLAAVTAPASAAPFYMRYDAIKTLPEQEGFTRRTSDPDRLIERSVADGVFTLDTRASPWLFDLYSTPPQAFNVAEGEKFRARWRMRTIETDVGANPSDVVFAITNSSAAIVEFFLTPDAIVEPGVVDIGSFQSHSLAPGIPHTFEMRSSDMQLYSLFVDGEFAFDGAFHDFALIGEHVATFGDTISGLASLSQWNYVEIAVIPKPSALAGLTIAVTLVLHRRQWIAGQRCET